MITESPPRKYRVKPYALSTIMGYQELSSRDLERLSGVSKSRINEIANGKATHVYIENGKKIAKALGVKIESLFLREL